jgi:hypothetical protein
MTTSSKGIFPMSTGLNFLENYFLQQFHTGGRGFAKDHMNERTSLYV